MTDRARAHVALLRQAQRAESPVVIVLDISRTRDLATTASLVDLGSFDAPVSVDQQELCSGRELLFDYLPAALELILFGAGSKAVPLAVLARTLGCGVMTVRPLGAVPRLDSQKTCLL